MISTFREIVTFSTKVILLMLFSTGNAFPALYVENVPVNTIHVPDDIGSELSDSINDFRALLFKRCDTRLEDQSQADGIRLKLVDSKEFSQLPIPLQGQAFRIQTGPGTLTISSKEELGLRMGLYYLLSEYGGCRWYWPGEIGEYIPESKDWKMGAVNQLVAPSYYSRKLSGLDTKDEQLWGIRNQLVNTIPISHNLHQVFSDVSLEKYPEWLSSDGATRRVPSKNKGLYWHPDLLAPGIARYAADRAADHFEDNPSSLAFSIGINDSYTFDFSPKTMAALSPLKYFRNRPVYSVPVFTFSDRVAKHLDDSYPEKYLSTFAYYWCEMPPPFKIDAQVIPFLTADRAQYYDLDFAREDRELIKKWAQAGPEFIGVYDYFESGAYWIPRHSRRQVESIPQNYKCGAKAYNAELFPSWAFEGPRAWVVTQLIFDCGLSIIDLENEFYQNYFGKAKDPVRHYYKLCEDIWHGQKGAARWLKYFKNPQQLELLSEEQIFQLLSFLKQARVLTKDEVILKRLKILEHATDALKSAHQYYHKANRLLDMPADKNSISAAVEFITAKHEFYKKMSELPSESALILLLHYYGKLKDLINPLPTWGVRYAANSSSEDDREYPNSLDQYISLLAKVASNNDLKNIELMQSDKMLYLLHPLAKLPSAYIDDWKLYAEPDTTSQITCIPQNDSDAHFLRFTGCSRVKLYQILKATTDSKYLLRWECRGEVHMGNFIRVRIRFLDNKKDTLATRLFAYPKCELSEWSKYAITADAPNETEWMEVSLRISGQQEDSSFEFRNPRLYQIQE